MRGIHTHPINERRSRSRRNWLIPRQSRLGVLLFVFGATLSSNGIAFEINTANSDVRMRWDNTAKYSAAWRVDSKSSKLLVDANMDDGDRNFDRGLVSSRLDLLSEFDISYLNYGLRLSGAAWVDDVYGRTNDNDSPGTASALSVQHNKFTRATKNIHGRRAELLDAFVYGRLNLGELPASFRLGRHTMLFGESLFFGGNGIAGGQAPVDVIKLLSIPSTQFKEILMPVGQVSGQVQVLPTVTVGGYYQFEWKPNRIPGSGSFLSSADFVGAGAERLFVPGMFGAVYFNRTSSIEAKNSGQGGLQIRWRPESGGSEYGFYATRFHSKDFTLYLTPAAVPALPSVGTYSLVYPEDIKSYGASFSTVIGEANVAGEFSVRRNTPLVSDPVLSFNPLNGEQYDNRNSPNYAVGKSAHAQISAVYLLKESPLWQGGDVLGEIAWNRRTSIAKNRASLDPNVTRDAAALRILFQPQYYQVTPGVDLTVPIGLGYNIKGRSSVDSKFNGGAEHGGDLSIGANFDYQKQVTFGINYVHWFGSVGTFLRPNVPAASTVLQYRQSLKDRDFISLFVQTTF